VRIDFSEKYFFSHDLKNILITISVRSGWIFQIWLKYSQLFFKKVLVLRKPSTATSALLPHHSWTI